MPGYILHLVAAKMALTRMKHMEEEARNAFCVGNLLPDVKKEKAGTHFRNPAYREHMIEYPDMELFRAKYGACLKEPADLGYGLHLYVDRAFFREYLPSICSLHNVEGEMVEKRAEVAQVLLKRTGEWIPRDVFFSEAYYYGDYTRMNTYLIERYQIPLELETEGIRSGIAEVEGCEVGGVLQELKGYLQVSASEVERVRVFAVEDLLRFLEETVERFLEEFCPE